MGRAAGPPIEAAMRPLLIEQRPTGAMTTPAPGSRFLEELAIDIDQIDVSSDSPYICQNTSIAYDCPYTCTSLAECDSCGCAVQDDEVGPGAKRWT